VITFDGDKQIVSHINNLYNTVFWALVQQGGETTTQAHAILKGTLSKHKHEILFSRFQINYNRIDERYRKGSVLTREEFIENSRATADDIRTNSQSNNDDASVPTPMSKTFQRGRKSKTRIVVLHCDLIQDIFWDTRPDILN